MEEVPEHILKVQNIFHDELDYKKPVNTYLTDTLQNHFIQSLKNEITKTGNYTESVNTILFNKNGSEYWFRKRDAVIFNITENRILDADETESLFNIPNTYKIIYNSEAITIDESKKIISEIFRLDAHPTLIEDEIPIEKLKEIYGDSNFNEIIIAPLSSKKTRNTIRVLKESKQKFIFLVPTKPLMYELSNDENIKLPCTTTSTSNSDIEKLLSDNLGIITYYDGFRNLNNYLKNKWEFILVVDEFHTLVLHSDFRNIIKEIMREMWNYKKIIQLSGTPYGCLTDAESFRITNFKYTSQKVRRFNYKIIPHQLTDNDPRIKFIDLIINHIRECQGKAIIFYNNKKIIADIKAALKLYAGIQDNEIVVYKSKDEDDYNSESSIDSPKLHNGIKIILTTSIIASGVSFMDEDFDSILIFNVDNFLDVFQLLGRPRKNKNVINVFDYISGLNNSKILNYSELLSSKIRLFKEVEHLFNTLLTVGSFDNSKTHYPDKIFINSMLQKFPMSFENDRIFITNLEMIYKNVMDVVSNFSFEYSDIRQWIFEQLGIYATIEQFQLATSVANINAINEEKKKIEGENLESILGLLINNSDEVITYCKSKNLINQKVIPLVKFKTKQSEDLIKPLKEIIHSKKGIINLFLILTQICEMPKNDAANFMRINNQNENKLINACKFIGLTNINAEEINNKDSYFAQKFDKFVERNSSKLFEIKDLQKQIKIYEKDSVLAKYYSTWPLIKLNGIYRFELKRTIKSKTNDAGTKYEITHQAYTKKINGIINHYKLGKEFEEPKGRAKRALSRFIQKIISYDVEISS